MEQSTPANPSNMKFENVKDTVAIASYVEQLLFSEYNWIVNRLSWLFLSQSFCLTAYSILLTSTNLCKPNVYPSLILKIGLPVIGIVSSLAVGIAVSAAGKVVRHLANERSRLTNHINNQAGTSIPLIGIDAIHRQAAIRSTAWQGALPGLLPWIIIILWLALLAGTFTYPH